VGMARDVPFFAELSKVELAKLIPSLEVITLEPGEYLNRTGNSAEEAVYYIREGQAEVVAEVGETVVLLVGLGPGDSFGPRLSEHQLDTDSTIRARTDLRLIRISKEAFQELCDRHPRIMGSVSRQLASRVVHLEKDLVRTKVLLAAHADELWQSHDPLDVMELAKRVPAEIAATAEVLLDPLPEPTRITPPDRNWGDQLFRWSTACSILPVLLYASWSGTSPAFNILAVLIWGAVNWYLNLLPDFGVALAMVGALVVLETAPVQTALSGFANETWFLVLGTYGLGACINRTGLLYRLALFILRRLPSTYHGQLLALALTGLILTPALPSSNGRVTMASPLAHELAMAMRLEQGSNERAGLALAVLHGFGQMFFMFMNGTGNCLVVWGLLPPEIRAEVTWFRWLLVAFPLGLLIFIGFLLVLTWTISGQTVTRISRRILDMQAATLGPLSRNERLTLSVMGLMLVAFISQPIHGIHPAWPAIAGLLLLMATQILDRVTFVSRIDWASLVLFGALWSLAGVVRYNGVDTEMARYATAFLEPVSSQPWLFLIVLGLLTYLVRLVIPWEAAIPLMMVASIPVLVATGYNPFIGGLVILATSNAFFVPQQNVVYLTVYQGTEEQDINHRQAARFGLLHAAITLVAILLSSFYWDLSGLIILA
jgi:DASS family divalent anion:Na+ symporter